jgi:taurine dioxygenase
MAHPKIQAERRFGYRLPRDEFTQLLQSDPGVLMRIVLDHGVVHVRDLHFGDPYGDLARVAREFGSPILYNGPRASACIEMSNSEGTPEPERNKAVEWHQDDIHTPTSASFTMLYCLEAPRHPPATVMADLTRAFNDLDQVTQGGLDGLMVRHDPLGGIVESDGEIRGRVGHQPAEGLVAHPLVLRHPRTGSRQLFALAGTAAGILGKADDEARHILQALKEHAIRPEYRTEVRLAAGSFAIWDNLAVLHSATPVRYSDRDGERRRVLRVSVR